MSYDTTKKKNDYADMPYFTTEDVDDAFKSHADAQDGYFSGEVLYGITRNPRVCFGVSRTWRDDKSVDLQGREERRGYRIVTNDCGSATEQTKRLVEIVSE
jgi:hypothetical protein